MEILAVLEEKKMRHLRDDELLGELLRKIRKLYDSHREGVTAVDHLD